MIVKTFYNQVGSVTRVVYELPRHEEVHKDTKMRLVMNNGNWFVIAELQNKKVYDTNYVINQNAKSHVPWLKTSTELYT
jgi:hypothetical protein